MTRALLALLLVLAAGCLPGAPRPVEAAAAPSLDDDVFARAVLVQLNEARTRPDRFAERLRRFRANFWGDRVLRPGLPILVTQEGPAAVDEAIRVMEAQTILPALATEPTLRQAAEDHVRDQGRTGDVSHYGADGRAPHERMFRYRQWRRTAETIAYGGDSPEAVVIQLIVDDGVPDRGHRSVILDPDYTHVGVSCGPHPVYRTVCVADFAAPD